MQVKVSKVFAKYINDWAKRNGKKYECSCQEMDNASYLYIVGDVFDAELYGDCNWKTGRCKYLIVTYPADWYAQPRYITTKELHTEFKRRGIQTLQELDEMLADMINI